jgi:hypothetical protein
VDETTAPVADEVTAAAVVLPQHQWLTSSLVSPINSQAHFLEHSIKAQNGQAHNGSSPSQYVMAADDSFTTNPAFKPVQYVSL